MINIRTTAHIGDGSADVFNLAMRINLLTRCTFAKTEITKIERQSHETRVDSLCCIVLKVTASHHTPAMGKTTTGSFCAVAAGL